MTIRLRSTKAILFLEMLFCLLAFSLLAFRIEYEIDYIAFAVGGGLALFNLLSFNLVRILFKHIDRFSFLAAQFLWTTGILVIYRISQQYALKQLIVLLISVSFMFAVITVFTRARDFGKWNYAFMVLTVLLLGSTLVLARTIGGAKNWIDLGFFSLQPSEFAKVLFIMVSAYMLSTRDKVRQLGPYILYAALCVVILLLERDLGAGLLICGTFIIVFFTATGRVFLTLLGVGVFAGGAYGSYKLFSHVRTRVQVWKDPWSTYDTDGYQIVQGLMALASGGLFGVGLGRGVPGVIPASHTDYIFTVIGEEFGIIFGIFIIIFYLVFIVRGILIALNAESRYDALLVFGCTAMLSLQSFIIIGGVIKLIPLTGITLPFISYGGSSLLSSVIQLSIIQAVSIKNGRRDEAELLEMGGGIE